MPPILGATSPNPTKMRMTMTKIGIDNGLKGAAAAMQNGKLVGSFLFRPAKPTVCLNVVEISDRAFIDWLSGFQNAEVLIEEPAMNMGRASRATAFTTAQAIASTAATFSLLIAAMKMAGITDILTTPAVSWQKLYWNTSQKSSIKRSIKIAQEMFGIDFIPPKCRTPHDGWTDAALMANILSDPAMRLRLIGDKAKRQATKERQRQKRKDLKSQESELELIAKITT